MDGTSTKSITIPDRIIYLIHKKAIQENISFSGACAKIFVKYFDGDEKYIDVKKRGKSRQGAEISNYGKSRIIEEYNPAQLEEAEKLYTYDEVIKMLTVDGDLALAKEFFDMDIKRGAVIEASPGKYRLNK